MRTIGWRYGLPRSPLPYKYHSTPIAEEEDERRKKKKKADGRERERERKEDGLKQGRV
jgi:hypothetical protein